MRQWCTYEWFYSAIDYPWFAKREFMEYLDHVGLGHVSRLTRIEWGVIRRYVISSDAICICCYTTVSFLLSLKSITFACYSFAVLLADPVDFQSFF